MKFKKPQSKDVSTGLAQFAGATTGLIVPNGIANYFAKVDNEALITEDQKKKKMHANIGMVLAGLAVALTIDGNDPLATGARTFSYTLAGSAMAGIIKPMLSKEIAKVDPTTTAGRLLRGSLGCPDMSCYPSYNMLQRPMLRMAEQVAEYYPQTALEGTTVNDPLG